MSDDGSLAASRVAALYQRHAARWAQARSESGAARPAGARLLEQDWLDRFLAALPGPRVLDLGCGTGDPLARWLAGQGCRITGVDAAPALLERARAALPGQCWIEGDMRTFDLGERFDGLLGWCSLFHLTPADQRPIFARLRRHAAPGAVLMFTSGPAEGEAIGSFGGEPLYHGSLSAPEYRAILAAQGFEILSHVVEDPDCGGLTVWLARLAPSA